MQTCDLFSEAGEELGSNHPAADCQKTQVIGLQNNHNLGHKCWQNMAMSQNECTAKNAKIGNILSILLPICGVCETFPHLLRCAQWFLRFAFHSATQTAPRNTYFVPAERVWPPLCGQQRRTLPPARYGDLSNEHGGKLTNGTPNNN